MSKYITHRSSIRNQRTAEPDILWRPVLIQPNSRAARKLATQYGLILAHASTIANLAGLGINGEAR
jgi:hypothetical protein